MRHSIHKRRRFTRLLRTLFVLVRTSTSTGHWALDSSRQLTAYTLEPNSASSPTYKALRLVSRGHPTSNIPTHTSLSMPRHIHNPPKRSDSLFRAKELHMLPNARSSTLHYSITKNFLQGLDFPTPPKSCPATIPSDWGKMPSQTARDARDASMSKVCIKYYHHCICSLLCFRSWTQRIPAHLFHALSSSKAKAKPNHPSAHWQ